MPRADCAPSRGIAQGRLEALLNFQTVIADLTGLPVANASLLDEATAAAEAMHMCQVLASGERARFVVHAAVHPQTLAVLETRARPRGLAIHVANAEQAELEGACGLLLQYPDSEGRLRDFAGAVAAANARGALVVAASDLLALTLLRPPGEWGADICVGSAQRFGVPLGFGGPHAAFVACRDEYRRQMPGRLVGVSRDAHGQPAYRLALLTREQHIRRDKATSNICTGRLATVYIIRVRGVFCPDPAVAIGFFVAICIPGVKFTVTRFGPNDLESRVCYLFRFKSTLEFFPT